jgi:hypothetical protein
MKKAFLFKAGIVCLIVGVAIIESGLGKKLYEMNVCQATFGHVIKPDGRIVCESQCMKRDLAGNVYFEPMSHTEDPVLEKLAKVKPKHRPKKI